MKPENYTVQDVQDSCQVCRHSFAYSDYDEGISYFCTLDNLPRPLCGSVALEENFMKIKDKELRSKAHQEWYKWADENHVDFLRYL